MTTAAIIGAGDLGGAVARSLALREAVDRIVLIDPAGTVAAGKALDIQQAGAIAGFHTRLRGTTDVSHAVGCDVCVVADRARHPSAGDAGDERGVLAMVGRHGSAPIVCAGAAQAPLLWTAAHDLRIDRRRLIGSAPEALASAVRALVGLEAGCAPGEVMLTVLGAPPDGFVVPWSDASIGGTALLRALTPVQVGRLDARIAHVWPPDVQALGTAAAVVVEGIVRSARRAFCVLTPLDGEFGVRRRIATLPCRLSEEGIHRRHAPTLDARDRTRLETVLERQNLG